MYFFYVSMKRTILISLLITSATLSAKAITWEEMQQHLKISGYMPMLYTCECADERSVLPGETEIGAMFSSLAALQMLAYETEVRYR